VSRKREMHAIEQVATSSSRCFSNGFLWTQRGARVVIGAPSHVLFTAYRSRLS
jgi:hypothetical protein